MIIFGTRGVTYTKDKGAFHCPNCATRQSFATKRVRRFFTLCFVPVLPLNLAGEYIECTSCSNTYGAAVLDYNPERDAFEFQAQFQLAVKRVMVEMMLADGVIDDGEVSEIRELYGKICGSGITAEEVRAEIAEAEADPADLLQSLRAIAPSLNAKGKELVVHAACMVAAADGTIQEEEVELLGQVGKALEMSTAHVSGILADVASPK